MKSVKVFLLLTVLTFLSAPVVIAQEKATGTTRQGSLSGFL